MKLNWSRYFFELFSVFLGISIAFSLNKWNEDRKDIETEAKILMEIKNGLALDLMDINENIYGHEEGIKSCRYFRKLILNEKVAQDSVDFRYFTLFRDYISIQNSTAYEVLKSKGLEFIRNDSLRYEIIKVYDFHFEIIKSLEEDYSSMQFHQNYFKEFNTLFAPYMVFNSEGKMIEIKQPIALSTTEKNTLLSYLNRIEVNRLACIRFYELLKVKAEGLSKKIGDEALQN